MNVYFNELSATTAQNGDAVGLVESLIEVSKKLKDEFGVEKIKIPKGFKDLTIANDRSLNQLIQHGSGLPLNRSMEIIGFLGNRVSEFQGEIDDAVEIEFSNKSALSTVKLNEIASYPLTGAYLLERPVISYSTPEHAVDFLAARFHLEYDGDEKVNDVSLENVFDLESINTHRNYLIGAMRQETFKPKRWKPEEHPIWNPITKSVLAKLNFPESLAGKADVKGELQNIGRLIAELNSWKHDERLSSYNTNKGQIRDIFVSVEGRGKWYLSTDVKNYKGTFELCDWEGRHEGQVSFTTGEFIPRGEHNPRGQYTDRTHNIKLKR
jgi:hypothetical protein